MRLRTLLALVRSGQLGLLLSTSRALRPNCRLSFLAAAASSGVLRCWRRARCRSFYSFPGA